MKNLRKQDGFTLVEMMVTLLIGTIIMGAAVTVLLLGLRVNNKSTETVSRQNTTRILLSALESMATEGSITKIETAPDYWKVWTDGETTQDTDDVVSFSYKLSEATVYTGDYKVEADGVTVTGTPLLEGVYASFVTLDNQQITVTIETDDGSYSSSVYCRLTGTLDRAEIENDKTAGNLTDDNDSNDDIISDNIGVNEETGRTKFVQTLAYQYRPTTEEQANKGWIVNGLEIYDNAGTYYVQWYNDQWPMKTPWCACFISWGLVKSGMVGPTEHQNWFANVDNFWNYFRNSCDQNEWAYEKVTDGTAWRTSEAYFGKYKPVPGDIVFFDWIVNGQDNPQHAGVVLSVDKEKGVIRTIEGNTDGMVAIREYPLGDPCILGYGVLNWNNTQ